MKILPELSSALRPFVEGLMTLYGRTPDEIAAMSDAERENFEELAYTAVLKELAHEIIEELA